MSGSLFVSLITSGLVSSPMRVARLDMKNHCSEQITIHIQYNTFSLAQSSKARPIHCQQRNHRVRSIYWLTRKWAASLPGVEILTRLCSAGLARFIRFYLDSCSFSMNLGDSLDRQRGNGVGEEWTRPASHEAQGPKLCPNVASMKTHTSHKQKCDLLSLWPLPT